MLHLGQGPTRWRTLRLNYKLNALSRWHEEVHGTWTTWKNRPRVQFLSEKLICLFDMIIETGDLGRPQLQYDVRTVAKQEHMDGAHQP